MSRQVLTYADIEKLLASGTSEVLIGPTDIVTALAQDRADEVGLRLVRGEVAAQQTAQPAPQKQPGEASPAAQVRAAVIAALGNEPDGLDAAIDRVLQAGG